MKHKLEIEKLLLILISGVICFLVGYNCKRVPDSKPNNSYKTDTIAFDFDNICRIDAFEENTEDTFYLMVYQDTTRFIGNIDIYVTPKQMKEFELIYKTVSRLDDDYMFYDVLDSMNNFGIYYNDSVNIFELCKIQQK